MSQQINLYSALYRKQKKPFTAAAMAPALGLMIALLALFYVYGRYQVASLERQVAQSDRQLKAGIEKVKALGGPPAAPDEDKKLGDRIAELEAALQGGEQVLSQTADPDRRHQYIEPLRALARQRLEGVWLTSISLAGDSGELSLTGRALHGALVPQYIERLSRDEAMRGRRFSTLAIEQTGQAKPAASGAAVAAAAAGDAAISFRLLATSAEGGS